MNEDAERHKYLRIADQLRSEITSGQRKPGDRLPSIPELTRAHGIAHNTAAAVLDVLTSAGLATARPGSGTFVKAQPKVQRLIRAWLRAPHHGSPFEADIEQQERIATLSYESRTVRAEPAIRERLALPDPVDDVEDALRTDYLYAADGEPVMLSTNWEPLSLTRGTPIVLPEHGMHAGRGVVERMMSIGVLIDDWVEEVGGRAGTQEECERLAHPPGSFMMTIRRTYYAGDLTVETADIVVPADRFALVYSGKTGRANMEPTP